jgi:hypothetical protein
MRDWVGEWVQEGRLYVWRYADPNRSWRGWHLAADPVGCRSVRNLLDRMQGGEPRYRTLRLERVTEAILGVPSYGRKNAGNFGKLRIEYLPGCEELQLSAEEDRLGMTVGCRRLRKLSAAFADIETGGGDFGIDTSDDRKADSWMFWWMPDVDYKYGRRA